MADDEPLNRKTFRCTRSKSKSSRTAVKLSLKRALRRRCGALERGRRPSRRRPLVGITFPTDSSIGVRLPTFLMQTRAEKMPNQQTSDNYSGKLPDSVPFFNLAGLIQQNSKLSTTLQALGKEWTEFVQARLREDTRLLQTLGECKELPSMQRAYTHFWEKALSQYEEE